MEPLRQSFPVYYNYEVHFTKGLFEVDNLVLRNVIKNKHLQTPVKIIIVIEHRIVNTQQWLNEKIVAYIKAHCDVMNLCDAPLIIEGGEYSKNNPFLLDKIYQLINQHDICRHSYVIAIGGGALLDMVGYATATAHRGIRLIRIPTTVLAQADSGVGVKNGINYFNKKNFLGTFAPPYAVLNDFNFLTTLEDRDWLSGIAEAVKVSLIKDRSFFKFIQANASAITQQRNLKCMAELIYCSAALHMQHIANAGDPFEAGSSRPLDFGHWAAHKLEQLTQHRLRHGEAVAIGVALDSTYSYLTGLLAEEDWQQILNTLTTLGFDLYVPELEQQANIPTHPQSIFTGLTEFKVHLGGELTIMLLKNIGEGIEVHSVDIVSYQKAIAILKKLFEQPAFITSQVANL